MPCAKHCTSTSCNKDHAQDNRMGRWYFWRNKCVRFSTEAALKEAQLAQSSGDPDDEDDQLQNIGVEKDDEGIGFDVDQDHQVVDGERVSLLSGADGQPAEAAAAAAAAAPTQA